MLHPPVAKLVNQSLSYSLPIGFVFQNKRSVSRSGPGSACVPAIKEDHFLCLTFALLFHRGELNELYPQFHVLTIPLEVTF